ncbi:hypothetical protein A3Q56_02918 [Intoshia linei]|uniref:Uncharacterized protein n=1 Tax=Intoshia linei TaxID=1819745 RepID=A0A177B4S3_9BILA|nr:hypothetical protein A3Q56_02918 [Intoshia linei]
MVSLIRGYWRLTKSNGSICALVRGDITANAVRMGKFKNESITISFTSEDVSVRCDRSIIFFKASGNLFPSKYSYIALKFKTKKVGFDQIVKLEEAILKLGPNYIYLPKQIFYQQTNQQETYSCNISVSLKRHYTIGNIYIKEINVERIKIWINVNDHKLVAKSSI